MRIATADGSGVHVRARRGSPSFSRATPGTTMLPMISALNGPVRYKRLWEIYITNPWLFGTIDLINTGIARVVLGVHKPDADGNSEPIPPNAARSAGRPSVEQSLLDLLTEPEPGRSWFEWARDMSQDRKVYGNALAIKEYGPQSTMPTALRQVPWPWVQVETLDGEILEYVVNYPQSGSIERYSPDQVIHWGRSRGAEGRFGCSSSKIEALEHTVRLYDAIARHLEAFFQNSARLSGQLQIDGKGKNASQLREEAQFLTEMLREFYTGPDNAGKSLVTTANWQNISADPKSAALVELKKLAREEIVSVYHVPPPLAGILESAIKSNVVELRSQYLRDVIGPEVQEFVDVLMIQLVRATPQWRGLLLRPDMDTPLRPDLEARATVYEKMRHIWTVQEMRQFEGKKPLTGTPGEYASTVWMPSGQVPLGMVQPQTTATEYGVLPTDADGVGDVTKPVAAPAQPQEGGTSDPQQQKPAGRVPVPQ